MRIALINPEYSEEDVDKNLGIFKIFKTPVLVPGLASLLAYVREKGFNDIKLFDEQIYPLNKEENLKQIINFKPDLIGITCLSNLLTRALEVAALMKKVFPEVSMIFGGAHPSLEPDSMIKEQNVDFLIRGEGENAFHQFLLNFETREFDKVPGLTYIDNGNVVHNQVSLPFEKLDFLPRFPFELFDKNREYYLGRYMSSRGCPFECTFCSSRWTSGMKYRYFSAERVVDDIEYIVKKYNLKFVDFIDDNFNVNKRRTHDICNMILARKLKFKWRCLTRSDAIDFETVSMMKEAGCYYIGLGFESGSERILKLMKKGETVEDHRKAVAIIKKAKIYVGGGFIIGFPTETVEETEKSLKLAHELKLDNPSYNLFVPFPGIKILDIVRQEGYVLDWKNLAAPTWSFGSSKRKPYVPKGRTIEELSKIQRKQMVTTWLNVKRVYKFFIGRISPYGMPHVVTPKEIIILVVFLVKYTFAAGRSWVKKKVLIEI